MSRRIAAAFAVALSLAGAGCPKRRPTADTLQVCVPYQLSTLDPHARDLLSSFALLSNVYEGLVSRDLDMVIRPGLARRWTNPDPLSWMFELRTDARFHDGSPVEAEDVVASFERLLGRSDLEVGFYGHVIADVKAIGRFTVQLRTRRPSSVLLSKLPFLVIVPRRLARAPQQLSGLAVRETAPAQHSGLAARETAPPAPQQRSGLAARETAPPLPAATPGTGGPAEEPLAVATCGSGPYRLVERSAERLVLERFEGYWGEPSAFRRVVVRTGRSRDEASRDFASGSCELACTSSAAIERLRDAPAFEVRRRTSLFLRFLGFDVSREVTPFVAGTGTVNPLRSRAVRQAVSLALDRRRLTAGSSARGIPSSQLVPPFVFGFTPRLPELLPDPERARALLAEAGFPRGFQVTLHARELFAETASQVAEQLLPVGVQVRVEALKDADYFELVRRRGASFFLSRFGCPTGDASDLFDTGLHSRDEARHYGGSNAGDVADPELDRMIEESGEIADQSVRRLSLEKLMQRAMEELYWVPLVLDEDVFLVRRGLAFTPRADSYLLFGEVRPVPEP